jgi:hypothetical protein
LLKEPVEETCSPPTPRSPKGSRRERERSLILEILADLRQVETCADVERLLLTPVLTTGRRFDPDCLDPRRALTDFAIWASRCSPAVLGNAALALKRERGRKVFAANLESAVQTAAATAGEPIVGSLPGVEYSTDGVRIERGRRPQQFDAWLAYHREERAARRPNRVSLMETHGFVIAPTEWPPTHDRTAA